MTENVRSHVIVSGKVQGVCFRMETKRVAESYSVLGWVRNNRNGTVEAVFEGEKSDVIAVIEWCKKGPSHSRVSRIDVAEENYTGEFLVFDITFG
ncbi:MAG: acylphosphatase [Desulfobacteraceae bacterium]|nr:MAG: acylphosphatase [Desulfobacteraceae bacterium]